MSITFAISPSLDLEEEYYTVTINVVNESTLEYRLYLGISDDLYDSNTGTFNLDEGEIVIESIPADETRSYVMDLDTDPYINKDWLMQYNHTILGWTTVLAEPDTDSDGYIFTGNETYTIMISSTGSFSIQMD